MPIDKLLIANRGEIACRIARTCRQMGIASVAVYSDADAGAPHTRSADEALRLGPAPAAESYLNIPAILDACARSGADAVHPGYGFLAENAAFARAVIDAGLTWVGPSPEAMEALGGKIAARRLAQAAGVPVLPGSDEVSEAAAARVGYPLLIKASAGGGGKGMRLVERPEDLAAAAAASRREAEAAFGDGALFIERYLPRPRHVEVQIFGDRAGRVIHLYERDCSIQRRHQKIIEESPAPALSDTLREALWHAAVRLGEVAGYEGAGTAEFLVDTEGEAFYFLEVNARLQVEHPVTEAICGLDLVRLQLEVAGGADLPDTPPRGGAAIEARLYAEDPSKGWLPQTGRLVDWAAPALPGLRVDTGVETGSEITVHYDPMLAKLIARGADREEARRRLVRGLERLSALGPVNNRAHLRALLRHPAFVAAELSTRFLQEHEVAPPAADGAVARMAALALERAAPRDHLPGVPAGWRNSRFRDAEIVIGGEVVRWRAASGGRAWRVGLGEDSYAVALAGREGSAIRLAIDGHVRSLRAVDAGDAWYVATAEGDLRLERDPPFPLPQDEQIPGGCLAAMTGTVRQVAVEVGQAVEAGALLVVLEAMKMEQPLRAAEAGVVAAVRVAEGQVVEAGEVLVVVEPADQ